MYTVIDVETTGLSPEKNRITEIALYNVDGDKITKVYSTLVNPKQYSPKFVQMATGISNEMVHEAPTFDQVAKKIKRLFRNRQFVAHNADFDYRMLHAEFKRAGLPFRRKKMCTLKMSRELLPGRKSYKLGNICSDLGIELKNAHRASADALATSHLLTKLLAIQAA